MRKLLVTVCIMMALVAIWGHTALAVEDSTKFCIEKTDKCNQTDETPGNLAGDTVAECFRQAHWKCPTSIFPKNLRK